VQDTQPTGISALVRHWAEIISNTGLSGMGVVYFERWIGFTS
jgi:hypothetical protein